MMFLMQNLGLIIADLISSNDKHWKLYITLREIITVVMCPHVTNDKLTILKERTTHHHKLFMKFYPNDPLKFKFHVHLFYVDLALLGPLKQFWCMRFEVRHKLFIKKARATTSRVNKSHTLAIANQLKLSHTFVRNNGFKLHVSSGPQQFFVFEKPKFDHIKLMFNEQQLKNLVTVPWIRINGTYYSTKEGNIVLSLGNVLENITIGKIELILVMNDKIYFVDNVLEKIKYNDHIFAYEANCSKTYGIIEQMEMKFFWPNYYCSMKNKTTLKNYVNERIYNVSKF